jgi:hypothetical protein
VDYIDIIRCETTATSTKTDLVATPYYRGTQGVIFTPQSEYNLSVVHQNLDAKVIVAHNHHEYWRMGKRNNPTAEAEPDILPNWSSTLA